MLMAIQPRRTCLLLTDLLACISFSACPYVESRDKSESEIESRIESEIKSEIESKIESEIKRSKTPGKNNTKNNTTLRANPKALSKPKSHSPHKTRRHQSAMLRTVAGASLVASTIHIRVRYTPRPSVLVLVLKRRTTQKARYSFDWSSRNSKSHVIHLPRHDPFYLALPCLVDSKKRRLAYIATHCRRQPEMLFLQAG